MRSWGIASCLLATASQASAQPADGVGQSLAPEPAPAVVGYGALPGGIQAPSAETLPAGTFAVGVLGGFGVRSSLLSADHSLKRGIGDLALAYAPTDMISLAVSFDGRFDTHSGLSADGDDGYVGDPRLLLRLAKATGKLHVGAQLGVWVPGKDAPSVALSATSVDARGLVAIRLGSGSLAFSAGFRLDNSAESVDDPAKLSAEDRVSLGVSDFHAAVGSARYAMSMGKGFFGVEASGDVFVGSGAPGPILRGGAMGGVHLTRQWSLFGFVQAAKVPELDYTEVMAGNVTLVPYEPTITGGVGLVARFGGAAAAGPRGTGQIVKNDKPAPIEVIEYAELAGQVLDDAGKPVAGAKVTVKLKNNTGTAATDSAGNWAIAQVPIGKTVDGQTSLDDTGAEITVEVEGKKPKTTTLTLAKGKNAVAAITLEPVLPPGQLKAVIRAAGTGKPLVNAVVTIEPGGQTATSDADGAISLDLPPGTYKATATLAGFKTQTLDVVIENNGVVVKNFELRK